MEELHDIIIIGIILSCISLYFVLSKINEIINENMKDYNGAINLEDKEDENV